MNLSHLSYLCLNNNLFYLVVQTFNPNTWEAEADISEFKASLVYRVSSRTARKTLSWNTKQNNPSPKLPNPVLLFFHLSCLLNSYFMPGTTLHTLMFNCLFSMIYAVQGQRCIFHSRVLACLALPSIKIGTGAFSGGDLQPCASCGSTVPGTGSYDTLCSSQEYRCISSRWLSSTSSCHHRPQIPIKA